MKVRDWLAAHGIGEAQLAARDATVGMERSALDPALAALIPGYYAQDKAVANKIDLASSYLDTELPAAFTPGAVLSERDVVGAGNNYDSGRTPAADTARFQALGAPLNAAPPPGRISGGPSGDWFAQHAPAGSPLAASTASTETAPGGASYGAYTSFNEPYTTPARPASVSGALTLPTWGESYTAPTQAELEASPGYLASQTAMQRGMERSAAAKGTVLSGGFVGRALPRAMGEHAAQAYGDLQARTWEEYLQRYGQFQGGVNNTLAARGVNEGAYQTDVTNALTQSNTRYGRFLDAGTLKRQSEEDLWRRNLDLSDLSLRAAALAK